MKYIILTLAAGALWLGGCSPCKPGAQRCNGLVVEICRSDKRWRKVMDCRKLHRTAGEQFDCAVRQVTPKRQRAFCRPQPAPVKKPSGGTAK